MAISELNSPQAENIDDLQKKLWIYTNYDCNLSCSYCVAESSPKVARRSLSMDFVKRLCDEADALGFEQVYFTGGEPFILPEIYSMLAYSCERFETTVLTNAMFLHDRRLEQLEAIHNERLIVQISLDGCTPEQHDPYRGKGSWVKTISGLHALLNRGFRVRLSTTQTPANSAHLDEICEFHQVVGIPETDHILRPLVKRGFSSEGFEVGKHNLSPEITVNAEGVYWHPLSTDPDLRVSDQIFPLLDAIRQVQVELQSLLQASQAKLGTFQ